MLDEMIADTGAGADTAEQARAQKLALVRSMERADRIHAAMRCRGYCGRFWLSDDFCCTGADWLLGILMLFLTGGVASFVLF